MPKLLKTSMKPFQVGEAGVAKAFARARTARSSSSMSQASKQKIDKMQAYNM